MNVLFVTHHYLSGNGGGVFASRAYINAFCELCDKVTLLYPIKNKEVAEGLNPKVICIPVSYDKPKAFKFLDLLFGRLHRYFGCMEKYLASGEYDTVVFDTSLVTWRNIDIAHKYGSKVITIHHNYQYEYSRDNTRGLVKLFTLFWIKKYERAAVLKSDLNLTLTCDDKLLLKEHYDPMGNSIIEVLGVFEPECRLLPDVSDDVGRGRYVITGTLSSMQSEKSLTRWIKNFYPELSNSSFFKSLTIAGKDPSEKLLGLCKQKGINVVSNPASLNEVLKAADVYICPVSLGGGLKLRIMDGLRYGLPVITHYVSARGYELFEDKCLFSYNDVQSFSSSIDRIQGMRIKSNEVQDLYHKEFSFESGLQKMKNILIFNNL